jgi:hypothetical protein
LVLRIGFVVWIVASLSGASAQDGRRRTVFNGRSEVGELWANVVLTGLRLDEPYLPMVIGIVNHSAESAIVDRDAIRLVGPDGLRYPMPTLKELRTGYGPIALDARAVSGAGIPYEVWRSEGRLVESNFFPNLTSSRRAIVIDEVTLPPGFAMIDLVYFAKPPGLEAGQPLLVEVAADGWPSPLRIGVVLD